MEKACVLTIGYLNFSISSNFGIFKNKMNQPYVMQYDVKKLKDS